MCVYMCIVWVTTLGVDSGYGGGVYKECVCGWVGSVYGMCVA